MEQLNWHWPELGNFSYMLMKSISGSGFPLETCAGGTGGQMVQTLPMDWHSVFSRLLSRVRALGRVNRDTSNPSFGLLLFLCSFKTVSNTDIRRGQVMSKQDNFHFPLDFQPADMASNIPTSRVPSSQPFLLTLPFPALLQGRISVQPYQPLLPPSFQLGFVLLFMLSFLYFFFQRTHQIKVIFFLEWKSTVILTVRHSQLALHQKC